MANTNKDNKIIYPELSYKIVGAAFEVYNNLGYGLREDYYQKAFAQELTNMNLTHEREKVIDMSYKGSKVGKHRLDFIVGNKIVVELKTRHALGYPYIKQVTSYLKSGGYKLAIILYFTKDGVKHRRVLNSKLE